MDDVLVSDVSADHGVQDGLVLLWGQAEVGGEGGGGAMGGWVHTLQPGVTLDLLQVGRLAWRSLEHPGDETGRGRESGRKEHNKMEM